ncbi:MAG TPA: hypothetical protein VMW20_03600 [Candidatus Nanoarchaeia archaeon]|nr:hypothetical protein [Candidatus Nanoarchaeia archaeon]
MDQKTGAKIMAGFLVLVMLLSIFPYFLDGGSSNSQQQNNQFDDYDYIQNDNFNVGGQLIDHNFNSISDALKMSPPDTYSAQYIDVEYMNSTTGEFWNDYLNPNITTVVPIRKSEVDGLYRSQTQFISTRQMYFADLPDDEILLLSTMTPKQVFFNYNTAITSYDGRHQVLIRENGGSNVMGEPTLFAPSRNLAESILSIIDGPASQPTAYDTFSPLLNFSEDYSEFQVVSSQVDFADKYYLGIYQNQDGNFTRTTIYQNATTETSSHLKQLARTGLTRGFSLYNLTTEGNILKVVITGQFLNVIDEDIENR